METSLFWLEKAGRIYEFSLPIKNFLGETEVITDEILQREGKLLRELDAHEFYTQYNKYNGRHFQSQVYIPSLNHIEQADADALLNYSQPLDPVRQAEFDEWTKFLNINTTNLTYVELRNLYLRYKDGYSKSDYRELSIIYGVPE